MELLTQRFLEKYARTNIKTTRNFINNVDWSNRLIGIKGSRGVGKTTLLLQYIKQNYNPDNSVLYTSLDHFYFSENRLYTLADEFYKKGGKLLVLDEIHRYKDWSVEIKNIYDDFPDLKIIFTGSSLLHLQKGNTDLSRRAVMYNMPGLSFREFMEMETQHHFPIFSIEEILLNHVENTVDILSKIKPLAYFSNYLNYGYYPFYLENKKSFHQKLNEAVHLTVDVDIPQFESVQISNIIYLKRLLQIISNSVPFKPNIHAISQRTGISINTLKTYIQYLTDAGLISQLHVHGKGLNNLNKPEKIYLNNTNLMYNLSGVIPDIGNLRETFFMNQVSVKHQLNASESGDFLINNQYTTEIGGKSKTKHQIAGISESFVIKDNIEVGFGNVIPLWLFGFLY